MCVCNKPVVICAPAACADDVTRTYWHALSINVPRDAHYLEFTPLSGGEATVLWNRTGSQAKKDKVQFKWNVIDVFYLTQADNGYYNLRKKDNTLMKRKRLQVEGNKIKYHVYLYVVTSMRQLTVCFTQPLN